MRTTRASRTLPLLAFVILSAACETATGPDGATDFQSALADYRAMDTALGSSNWAGFRALGGRTPFSGSPAAIDAVAALGEPSFGSELAERLGGPAAAPIISGTHRGATFVYDPAKDDYAVDPKRTGAPATGVRFILYKVDAAGKPIVGQETGYADLVDEGDGSREDIVLHLTAVQNGSKVLDYRTTLDDEPSLGALTVKGFLVGDGVRLDFDIEAAGRKTTPARLDVSFAMRIDARDFSIEGEVQGAQKDVEGEGAVDLTVRHGDQSMRVDVVAGKGKIEGTLYVKDDLFATVSGDAKNPTILGKSGEPISGVELLVLHRMIDAVEDVFDFLEDLIDPVDDLVLLGIVL